MERLQISIFLEILMMVETEVLVLFATSTKTKHERLWTKMEGL